MERRLVRLVEDERPLGRLRGHGEGEWWDVCGSIDIGADKTGTIKLWDEDYSKGRPDGQASVTLSAAGTGEHGTLTSRGGTSTDVDLEHADWIAVRVWRNYERI